MDYLSTKAFRLFIQYSHNQINGVAEKARDDFVEV